MADTTPTPTPTPAPKTKRPPSAVNRKHVAELANSRAVAKAAADPANAALLAGVDFDATLPGQMNGLAERTETAIGKLTGARAAGTDMTAQQLAARDALLAVIAPIQTAARRKYTGLHDLLRQAYFIGGHLSHEALQEVSIAAIAIRDRLVAVPPSTTPVDTLPGVKPAQITALSNAITLYAENVTAGDEQQNQNAGALNAIETNLATLAGMRHQVQLAAEQAVPWRTPGVAATRAAFLLPDDRPLPG